jgi:hypothetical protein
VQYIFCRKVIVEEENGGDTDLGRSASTVAALADRCLLAYINPRTAIIVLRFTHRH